MVATVTKFVPLIVFTALVTLDQTAGGFKLGVDCNANDHCGVGQDRVALVLFVLLIASDPGEVIRPYFEPR